MSDLNIFYDEWRECLLAHYEYILREGEADTKNEKSLVEVLNTTGFAESEISTLRAAILGSVESNAIDEIAAEVEIVEENRTRTD